MNNITKKKYFSSMIAFISVLTGFLAIVVVIVVSYQRSAFFSDAYKNFKHEVDLMGTALTEPLLKDEFAKVVEILDDWGRGYSDIVTIKAITPNKIVLHEYSRKTQSRHTHKTSKSIRYRKKLLLKLSITFDMTPLEERVSTITWNFIIGLILFTIFLGFALWKTIQRLAIVPMAKEIANRQIMEEKLQELKEKAEHANQAKSEFLANMSHEIRTPMNAILGFSEILSGKLTDPKHKHYLASIQSSGKTLLTLINDILDISKVEAGKLTLEYNAVNPHVIFSEMEKIFNNKIIEKELDFIKEIDPFLPEAIMIDESRIRQILLNLIGNAIKFTSSGHVKLSAIKLFPSDEVDKLDLIVSVEDTGMGIPEDQKADIFQAFVQQKEQSHKMFGGTGLGLAITKRLVELMNGEIFIESAVGKGSTFSIVFKAVEIATSYEFVDNDLPFEFKEIIFKPSTVLIVDDIEYNRDILKGYLDETNLSTLEAVNGQEAVDILKSEKPDIILMDYKMPVMDGLTATEIIKSDPETKDIPIVVVTASVRRDIEQNLIKISDGFQRKPISKHKLFVALMEHLSYTTVKDKDITQSSEEDLMPDPEQFDLSPEMISRFPELIDTLNDEMKPLWERISDVIDISDIKEFATELQSLASEYGCQSLSQWAHKLESQAQLYDIDSLTKTLKGFPELMEGIKNKMNKVEELNE